MINNKFKIVSPSYNNEKWVDIHTDSILEQTYDNYEVLYINDCSTDNTLDKVEKLVGNNSKFKIISNEKNMGATHNYINIDDFMDDDEEIIVHLDGDDWLAVPNVLEELNTFYNENDFWMTYGGFVVWNGGEETKLPYPQNTEYDSFVHKYNMYRKDLWRASHLRTFKWFLFKNIDKKDFVSKIDNKLYWHASDLSWSYPALEMCPTDKIGVVDFTTHIYNASEENQVRTREREHQDNQKFELEIRNKKRYKTVKRKSDLRGEKLPQVNTPSPMAEIGSIPTKFTYCFNQKDGDFDMLLLNDNEVLEYLNGSIKIDKKVPIVVRLHEQRDYFNKELMKVVIDNHDKFHTILTFDKIILESVTNATFCNADGITQFVIQPNTSNITPYHSELYTDTDVNQTIKIYEKTNFDRASCITSTKSFLPGHTDRLNFVYNIKDRVDLYGRGIREIPSKLDALHNYAFSVGIENNVSKDDYYFTEKLLELFVTGTVPIYYGCPNISEFFDMNGILTFTNQNELDEILNNLSQEKYNSMFDSVKNNFDIATKNFVLHNDSLYTLHLEKILN